MDLNLSGKVALISGASRGIGLAISRRPAEEGIARAVAARDEAKLYGLAAEVETRGGQVRRSIEGAQGNFGHVADLELVALHPQLQCSPRASS